MEVSEVMESADVQLLLVKSVLFLEPLVIVAFLSRRSLSWVKNEHLLKQIFSSFRNILESWLVKAVSSSLDSFNDLSIISSIKRRCSCQKDVENDSKTPNITFGIVGSSQDFRSNVIRLEILENSHRIKLTVPIFS